MGADCGKDFKVYSIVGGKVSSEKCFLILKDYPFKHESDTTAKLVAGVSVGMCVLRPSLWLGKGGAGGRGAGGGAGKGGGGRGGIAPVLLQIVT